MIDVIYLTPKAYIFNSYIHHYWFSILYSLKSSDKHCLKLRAYYNERFM